jgi:hypothetical protein
VIASKLSLVSGITHSIISLNYLVIGIKLLSLYKDFNVDKPNPILQNRPFILFITFASLSFLSFVFLKNKEKKQIRVPYGLPVSLFLLITPFIILCLTSIYANKQVVNSLNKSFSSTKSDFSTPTPKINSLKTYKNNNIYFQYPQSWTFETINTPFSENDYSFYLKPSNPSIERSVVLTVQILRSDVAEYYFNVCCSGKKSETIGRSHFYATGPIQIDRMLELTYVSGNSKRLVMFSLGVGKRDDPLPVPIRSEVEKELKELNQILSSFIFYE